jgi:hypothetical protein
MRAMTTAPPAAAAVAVRKKRRKRRARRTCPRPEEEAGQPKTEDPRTWKRGTKGRRRWSRTARRA